MTDFTEAGPAADGVAGGNVRFICRGPRRPQGGPVWNALAGGVSDRFYEIVRAGISRSGVASEASASRRGLILPESAAQ